MATKLGILEVQRTKRVDGSTELSLDFGSATAENGKYDEVVLQIVPQEIDTLASLATRCREVLKPGGKFTIRCAETTDSKVPWVLCKGPTALCNVSTGHAFTVMFDVLTMLVRGRHRHRFLCNSWWRDCSAL